MCSRRDVEVELEFLPTELGGRTAAARSGYRPQLFYDGRDWDAAHEYPDVAEVLPGERARAYLTCLSPELHDQKLTSGTPVLFREGQRIVAFGTVTRIIELMQAAQRARVADSLDAYYRALGLAAEQMETAEQRTLCKTELALAVSLRQQLREASAAPDMRDYVTRQMALAVALGTVTDELMVALEVLRATAAR